MTRKEEIKEASINYQISKCPMAMGGDAMADLVDMVNVNPSFIAGAEWADRTMIEKACQFLNDSMADFWGYRIPKDDDFDDFIVNFKKAMEQ